MSRPANYPPELPYIDTAVKHVGVSALRGYNAANLRKISGLIVIRDGDEPLCVLVRYDEFMKMQEENL